MNRAPSLSLSLSLYTLIAHRYLYTLKEKEKKEKNLLPSALSLSSDIIKGREYIYIYIVFSFFLQENVSFFSSFEKAKKKKKKRNTIPNYFNGCRVCVSIFYFPPLLFLSGPHLQMKQVCFITQVSS